MMICIDEKSFVTSIVIIFVLFVNIYVKNYKFKSKLTLGVIFAKNIST